MPDDLGSASPILQEHLMFHSRVILEERREGTDICGWPCNITYSELQ